MEVSVLHTVVRHVVLPRISVGEVFTPAKFNPFRVSSAEVGE